MTNSRKIINRIDEMWKEEKIAPQDSDYADLRVPDLSRAAEIGVWLRNRSEPVVTQAWYQNSKRMWLYRISEDGIQRGWIYVPMACIDYIDVVQWHQVNQGEESADEA